MKIAIADRNSSADALAKLFSANLHENYISHSELQGSRAIAVRTWAPDIERIFREEIQRRLGEPMSQFPRDRNWLGVVHAHEGNTLVALAYVTIAASAPIPFGVIEDIVVEKKRRRAGLGEELMRWLLDRFAEIGIQRTFLESGTQNHSAHRLFARLGFERVSIVMMRDA